MRFRISAIQDEGLPTAMNHARLQLEDWLNAALADGDFGSQHVVIMIVVFATSSLPKAPAVSRLAANGDGTQTLALHVTIDPEVVSQTEPERQLQLLASHIVQGLPERPLRKPRGLDYTRIRQALLACIQPFAKSAA